MTKAELRRIFRAKRNELGETERRRMSRAIADRFFASFDLSKIANLHCFIPIEKFNEVDTMLIFRRLWAEFPHVRTYVPRADAVSGTMQNVLFTGASETVRTHWGIDEPAAGDLAADTEFDLVIAPGLVVDEALHRVGYGKGFYDRFLRNCRPDCVKVGVSFFEPVEAIDDIHDGDVRLDYCITPAGKISVEE
ncbi:MAG: 5-formyltetrahydrofolate cyclo-ligase [Acidobacteriota bacterium]